MNQPMIKIDGVEITAELRRLREENEQLAANQMPKHLNASYEGDDLYTGEQLRAAIAAEREACAKLCDEVGNQDANTHAWDAAAAIRARG
jgi:hypothetical protein